MVNQLKKYYSGFSTRAYEETGDRFELYNVKCVEEDLLNQIFTIKGDRVNMPTWGTRIPLLVFEPNDADAQAVIMEDLTAVFAADPRVEVINLDLIPALDQNALIASVKLRYIEFSVTKDLAITIQSQ